MIIDYNWETDSAIKDQIADLIIQKKLIPVIGSGFTRNCKALRGKVPSGEDMSSYLKDFAAKAYGKDKKHYENSSFPELCTYYSKRSTPKERFEYFSSNFTGVELSTEQIEFLKIFPQYIYTLNIDDGIEKNCTEYHVVLPRHEFSDEYINTYSTVFKVHGDVHHYLKYIENEELIFNKRQYIESIKNNKKMLSKFKDDFSENNLLYIGCSLTEEPDLMSVVTDAVKARRAECQSYYITSSVPEEDKKDLLEDYGITACIIVKDYHNFYAEIIQICREKVIIPHAIDVYREPNIVELSKEETTIKFLLDSNLMIPYPFEGIIYKPFFFTKRIVSEDILRDLKHFSPVHIIYGHRVSGKTFCLVDIFEMIKDKTRYFFPSNTKISDNELNKLFEEKNSLFLFDTNCLEADQIFRIAKEKKHFSENNNYIVVVVNSSDRNGLDLMTKRQFYGASGVKNIISKDELDTLNKKMQSNNLPTFITKEYIKLEHKKKSFYVYYTILDNLCMIADNFSNIDKTFNLPDLSIYSSYKELALLILLATQYSLSSYYLFYFDLHNEAKQIAKDFPVHFELVYFENNISRIDSNMKLITNSRYFLLKYLGNYSKNSKSYQNILFAYKYIYKQIHDAEDEFDIPRKMLEFIKFDVLNDVFYRNNNSAIGLIKYIYEGMEDVMNVNPQFKHQRAKSIFWLCPDSHDEIVHAAKYVNLARYDIENILKSKYNEKLKISLEHVKYTQASIWGRICNLENYINEDSVINSINYYVEALSSDENYGERVALMEKKTEKHIYEDLISLFKHIKANMKDNEELVQEVNSLAFGLNFDLASII